jgi:hypothetical protein
MMRILKISLVIACVMVPVMVFAQSREVIDIADINSGAIFDDRQLLEGYAQRFAQDSRETLVAMINDDSIGYYKMAAAIRVFKINYAPDLLAQDKPVIKRILISRLNQTDSPFVQVELMHTLIIVDRYQYFPSMSVALLQKLDHYNQLVQELAYQNLRDILDGTNRQREARIVFNQIRKALFLARNRLAKMTTPNDRLKRQLYFLRWSIKILGTQELKELPSEVIRLLS